MASIACHSVHLVLTLFCMFAASAPLARAQFVNFAGFPSAVPGTALTGLDFPSDIAMDASGNFYMVDGGAGNVYKFTFQAGTYVKSVLYSNPTIIANNNGIAVDATGDVYFTNGNNGSSGSHTGTVYKMMFTAPNTYSAPVAIGPGGYQWAYDVSLDSAGDVYVVDRSAGAVHKLTGSGTTYTQITVATGLIDPQRAVEDDVQNAFILDNGIQAICEAVTSDGGVSYPAGTPPTIYNLTTTSASGMAIGPGDVIYLTDGSGNGTAGNPAGGVSQYTPATPTVGGTAAGPYSRTAYYLALPNTGSLWGLAIARNGSFYFGDFINQDIGKISLDADFGSSPIGTAGATSPLTLTFVASGMPFIAPQVTAVTQGAPNQDFTGGGTISFATHGSVSSATATIAFNPTRPGARAGAAVLTDTSGAHTIANIHGVGMGPEVALTPGVVSTFAGSGVSGYSGDGGAAASAKFNVPAQIAFDGAGNLYIADSANYVVRKVDTTGKITTVAGNGTYTVSLSGSTLGDGGAATSAGLSYIIGVAIDGAGNLYIADNENCRIRKVDTAGIITTVAGTGAEGFSGDGGLAINAQLDTPYSLAFDAEGDLFIADYWNQRIREISPAGIITTVAGSGTPDLNPPLNGAVAPGYSGDNGQATQAQLAHPTGLAVDSAGHLYIADFDNSRIREVDLGTGVITTVAGNGTAGYSGDGDLATNAELNGADAVALDSAGNLYISDSGNGVIRKVNAVTHVITALPTSEILNASGPATIILDSAGNLYISDDNSNDVYKVDVSKSNLTFVTPTALETADAADHPQAAIISNIGNAALTIATPGSGSNPSISTNFALSGASSCPQLSSASSPASQASGVDCTLAVDFTPTLTGAITGSVVLTDNALNVPGSTQTITLRGRGVAASTTTTLSSSLNPSTFGQAVMFTATVAPTAGTGLPAGTVQFSIDGTAAGAVATLNGTGAATFSTSALTAGSHTITAVYTPSSTDFVGSNGTLGQVVNKAALTAAIIGTPTRVYDGTTTATLTSANYSLSGFVGADNAEVTQSSGTYAAAAAGPERVTALLAPANFAPTGATSLSNYALPTTATGLGTITAATSVPTLATNPTSPYGQPVTVTITVPTIGSTAPAGTVTVYSGGQSVGTGTLGPNGTAVVTIPGGTLPVGSDPITVGYSGGGSYGSSASVSATIIVTAAAAALDFTLTLTSTPSQTVLSGLAAAYATRVAPTNSVYPGVVSFTATGLPAGATATFTPATVAAHGGPTPVNLSIQTASLTARNRLVSNVTPIVMALLLVPWAGGRRMRRQGRSAGRYLFLLLVLLGGVAATAGLAGCGTNNGFFGHAPQTYNVTVTATSGSMQHSVNVTLNVE